MSNTPLSYPKPRPLSPAVNKQVDCPEDVDTYIHRVGRTARNDQSGKSLLLLVTQEAKMIDLLQERRIPLKKTLMNKTKLAPVESKISQLLTQDPALKHLAQKALVSYLRSLHLQRNKTVFDVKGVPAQALAESWGLATMPRIRFTTGSSKPGGGNRPELEEGEEEVEGGGGVEEESGEEEEEEAGGKAKLKAMGRDERRVTKLDKLFGKKNNDVLSANYSKLRDIGGDDGSDDDGDLFTVASNPKHAQMTDDGEADAIAMPRSKRSLKKIRVTDANPGKLVFDDAGNAVSTIGKMAKEGAVKEGELDPRGHMAAMQVSP